MIIGPFDGYLATWIDTENLMHGYDSSRFGKLSKIQAAHDSNVLLLELIIGYQDRDVPARTLVENRSVYVHSDSQTLPRDLEYELFDFRRL